MKKIKKVICSKCKRKQKPSNVCEFCGYWDMWGIDYKRNMREMIYG